VERKTQSKGLINLLTLGIIGGAGYYIAHHGNTLAGLTAMVFMGIGFLVAVVSWFQMRLEEREYLEKLEFDELTKSASASALFTSGETEVFPAQRSREQFERFFVPVFTVLLFMLQAGSAFLLWRWLDKVLPTPLVDPSVCLSLFAIFGLLLFLFGKYSTSLARFEGLRLLRPGATYVLLSAYLCAIVTLTVIATILEVPHVDLYVARGLAALLFLVALETLIGLILELYRPRVKGKVERPVYESRLVSLLGQPEGLFSTAAQTLDYQFGFKVSETWFYRLMVQWLPWLVVFQLVVLLVSSCFVFIDTGEQAMLEHFGNPVAVLPPGAHLTYPWPIDKVHRYATQRIQSFSVGYTPDALSLSNRTVLWTVPHNNEQNFLVASRESAVAGGETNAPSDTNSATGRPAPPVSLLTVSIPVQFQITNLEYWVYNNEEPETLIQLLANREVVRYLVSVDVDEIMAAGRLEAANTLRDRIQAAADKRALGANIIFVGLQDIHPPTKVAPDYEKVVAAVQTRAATILAAQAEAIRTNALAGAEAFRIRTQAQSDLIRREVDAQARAALFTNQLPAYLAAPSVYVERAYYQAMAESLGKARKYVLLITNSHDVAILNLEDNIRRDIMEDITLPPPPKTAH
jgi:modulator of FtsH protease HflK